MPLLGRYLSKWICGIQINCFGKISILKLKLKFYLHAICVLTDHLNKINCYNFWNFFLIHLPFPQLLFQTWLHVSCINFAFAVYLSPVLQNFSTASRESLHSADLAISRTVSFCFLMFIYDANILHSVDLDLYLFCRLQESDSIYWLLQQKYTPKLHKAIFLYPIVVFWDPVVFPIAWLGSSLIALFNDPCFNNVRYNMCTLQVYT